jgi:V/A-type H+-transporting ATPase subunit D
MADRLDIAPTEGNLLDLQAKLDRIHSGRDLLDRKRQVLVQEIMDRIEAVETLEKKAREQFQSAHAALRQARMQLGTDRVRSITLAPTAEVNVAVRSRSIMGAKVPKIKITVEPQPLPYGPGDTSAALDQARQRWLAVVRLLQDYAETVTTVWKLAMELRKTQRRVNALESTVIPRHESTVAYIVQVLEEENREEIVRAKKVKELQG